MICFRRVAVVLLCTLGLAGPAQARAQPTSRPIPSSEAVELAGFVEARAARTSFAKLEAFGEAASERRDREGLNRLYHVTWTILNQGDFERAGRWNARLAFAARRQGDDRYVDIARLNDLTIRYDRGETGVAAQMARFFREGRDWFVRAHAARLTALSLIDRGELGAGLDLLAAAQADIPARDPYAATARAGVWEVAGMALKDLNDFQGATAAFRKFEIDYSNPEYPRPDFDSLYNLTMMAVGVGDHDRARQFFAAHHRVAHASDLPSLAVYDASLCATVAAAREDSRVVLSCLEPYGEDMGEAAFLALETLPIRAIARARTGQVEGARRDLERLRALQADTGVAAGSRHAEAEVLFAEGRTADAYRLLSDHHAGAEVAANRAFSAGVHQVVGDMQAQLDQRRSQLETARANSGLLAAMVAIGVVFMICAVAVLLWRSRQAGRLKSAQQRAEDANRAKSEFLANMSHEIRTPLNGVVGMADALARRTLGPLEREMVDLIRSSSGTLERLLTDILDSAKIEAGQVAIERDPFDLTAAVRDVSALWSARAAEKGVELRVEIAETVPGRVLGDGVRVRQVLTNLVSNALKFTEAGAVTLSVTDLGDDRLAFRVEDTGVGFGAEQKARIFQRFQQADGSITRRFGGTGLGLAISTALVDLMGGELACDSEPGRGSVFHFDLPLPAVEAEGPSLAPALGADEDGAAPLRILLADDHPANRKVVEIMLAPTETVLVAVADGREALEAFDDSAFDLVLMDMQMPVMDGLSATRAIRALEAERGLRRTPIVMLTANAMAEHVEAGRAAGADGHLTKPITVDSLMAAIEQALAAEGQIVETAREAA